MSAGTECDLTGRHRRHTGKGGSQFFLRHGSRITTTHNIVKFPFRHRHRIQLILLRRLLIPHTGQELPLLACSKVHRLEDTDHLIVAVTQNQIAVLAHDLGNQVLLRFEAHFVVRLKGEASGTLKAELGNADQLGAAEMLAQSHTEHRRNRRVFRLFRRYAKPRRGGTRIDKKTVHVPSVLHLQEYHIPLGHIDFFNFTTAQLFLHLAEYTTEHAGIKCHSNSSFHQGLCQSSFR